MTRKITLALSLLVLVALMSGISFASAIQITLGPSTGSVTLSPLSADFSSVAGTALQQGGLGLGTFGFLNGSIPVTSSSGPIFNLGFNAEAITVDIGSDVLNGYFKLSSFTMVSLGPNTLALFAGYFNTTSATPGFVSTGFAPGTTA